MRLGPAILMLCALLTTVDGAIVGASVRLFCARVGNNYKLRPGHHLWAEVRLMERDFMNDDTLATERKKNSNRSPFLSFTLYSNDVDDGIADDQLEVYLSIRHNCVRDHATGYGERIVEVGNFPVYALYPRHKDVGTIFLY
ncbi:hypothetical protein Y032_0051g2095 [Ancylostoma ceylanicum]|uniref:Transthyretin-like family protein n=1 Tax=Ancylostoma ceylanicum TaxID=53326 RepID=A0A016U9F2_9BILA|nr:hypothetical protein Y032_0051g2095 [Ancylostoma ceylanicum]